MFGVQLWKAVLTFDVRAKVSLSGIADTPPSISFDIDLAVPAALFAPQGGLMLELVLHVEGQRIANSIMQKRYEP